MDTSPTALFDSYEQDFQQFIETIRQKLEGEGKDEPTGEWFYFPVPPSTAEAYVPPEQRKTILRRVDMELDEADEMVCPTRYTISRWTG